MLDVNSGPVLNCMGSMAFALESFRGPYSGPLDGLRRTIALFTAPAAIRGLSFVPEPGEDSLGRVKFHFHSMIASMADCGRSLLGDRAWRVVVIGVPQMLFLAYAVLQMVSTLMSTEVLILSGLSTTFGMVSMILALSLICSIALEGHGVLERL
jgi:hypothetical protein